MLLVVGRWREFFFCRGSSGGFGLGRGGISGRACRVRGCRVRGGGLGFRMEVRLVLMFWSGVRGERVELWAFPDRN